MISASAPTNTPPVPARSALTLQALPWVSWLLLAASGVMIFRPLTATWNDNPNYAFGWLIPVVAIFLFFERWPQRPAREPASSLGLIPILGVGCFCYLAFRLAAETDPDWRPGLAMLVGLYVVAWLVWLRLYGGPAWLRYFAFPVCFLFLSLPWFFEIEYPLVQGLMRWNAILVSSALQGIGVSATPAGNIIHLQNCDLGVEEACSGILSLQASLMIGCLLGEVYRLPVGRRFLLVGAALGLALVGNFLRTFFLALMAFYSGAEAVPLWHDWAGYFILIFTGVGTWLMSLALAMGQVVVAPVPVPQPAEENFRSQSLLAQRFAVGLLVGALVAEAVTQLWFGWRETKLTQHPTWTAQLPTQAQKVKMSDVTLEALRCDEVTAGRWNDAKGWNWTTYWLRYDPKPYTRVVLGWHTPDNCLPSIGMIKEQDYPAFTAQVNGVEFYVQPKRFRSDQALVYIFWVVYPNSGDLPPEKDTRISQPFLTKFQSHLQDMWEGYRGVGVETLEIAVTGPVSYEEAKAGYLAELGNLVARKEGATHGTSQ